MPVPVMVAFAIGSAAAQTAASVYSTKKASKTNDLALAAQERDAQRQADITREENAQRQKMYDESLDADKSRWNDYININRPQWDLGQKVLGSLYDIAGGRGQAPNITQGINPNAPPPSGAAPAPVAMRASGGGGGFQPPAQGGQPMRMPSLMELAQMAKLTQGRQFSGALGDAPLGLDALANA